MTRVLNPSDDQLIRLIKLATDISICYNDIMNTDMNHVIVDTKNKKITIHISDKTSTRYLQMLCNAQFVTHLRLNDLNMTDTDFIILVESLLTSSIRLISIDIMGNKFDNIPLDKISKLFDKCKKLTIFKINPRVNGFDKLNQLLTENMIAQLESELKEKSGSENIWKTYYL